MCFLSFKHIEMVHKVYPQKYRKLNNRDGSCQEPAMGFPTHDKVMQESPDGQGESGLKDHPPPQICLSIYPKTRICLFYYFTTFTNSSDINGGLSPTTFLWRKST